MMGPSSLKEMMWAAKPDDPDAFRGRMSLLVGMIPKLPPEPDYLDHTDLPLARGMVIAKVLSARTLEGCERAGALLEEWLEAFPNDEEMRSYGGFVNRMSSALRRVEAAEPDGTSPDGPRAARGHPQSPDDPADARTDV